jgi:hypothetical protein
MPCPPDILELGRATWTLLHSVAAYYPDQPTEQQQLKMRAFVEALGEFYPCEVSDRGICGSGAYGTLAANCVGWLSGVVFSPRCASTAV